MGNKVSLMLQDDEIKLISEETGFTAAQIERLYSRFKSLDKSGICGSLSKQDFLSVPELAINPLCDRIVHMFFVDCDEDHERINFKQFMKVLAIFKSSPSFRLNNDKLQSRKDSIQSLLTPLTQNSFRHSRHSSCDGFLNYYPVQNHMTNQHSVYYVASTNNLSKTPNYLANNHKGYKSLVDPYEPRLYFLFKIYDIDEDDRISLDDLKKILKILVGNYINEIKIHDLAVDTMNKVDKNGSGYIEFDEFCAEFLQPGIDDSYKRYICSSIIK